ncbi:MAG: GDP-L-fucose synthase [Castellaniella sp.]|nr:GDP-L-fucose synthase [Castellaniella sp.]
MRILLTGGSGMVGSNILDHPLASGYEILAPSSCELDLCRSSDVEAYMARWQPDLVIHAAGKVGGIQANMLDPVGFLSRNLEMGHNVVLGAKKIGVARLINLGSSCMYPRGREHALHEDDLLSGKLEPTNEGYALAKILVAKLCDFVSAMQDGFQYRTIIPCNLYGRHDSFDPARSHMVPSIIRKLHQAKIQGHDSVEIWGDGQARREFMYAGDLADCIWRAVARFDTLPQMMNVGIGRDYTVDEYYTAAARIIGYQGRFLHNLNRPIGMRRKLLDIARSESWGWRPRTSLDAGLAASYDFYLRNGIQEGRP